LAAGFWDTVQRKKKFYMCDYNNFVLVKHYLVLLAVCKIHLENLRGLILDAKE